MRLPNKDDLKITIPVSIDIDIHTAKILCNMLNIFIKENKGEYKLSAIGFETKYDDKELFLEKIEELEISKGD